MELKEKEDKDDKDKAFRNVRKLICQTARRQKVPNNSGFERFSSSAKIKHPVGNEFPSFPFSSTVEDQLENHGNIHMTCNSLKMTSMIRCKSTLQK